MRCTIDSTTTTQVTTEPTLGGTGTTVSMGPRDHRRGARNPGLNSHLARPEPHVLAAHPFADAAT